MLILLADDDDEMRALLRLSLGRHGYEILEAWDGADLILKLARSACSSGRLPDLIICDICMPWESGLSVLKRLRLQRVGVPVILMTAFGDEGTHGEAARLGAAVLLDKPFTLDDLLREVRALIG